MKKIIALAIVFLIALPVISAQTAKSTAKPSATPAKRSGAPSSAAAPALPSRNEIDAALQRSFGYDPAISWNILDIRQSPIPGVADVLVSMNKQNPVQVFVSADGQNAIIGELIPFGPNPFAPARAKLKDATGPSRGPAKGVIDIVEFSDLECPHCKVAQPILEKLAGDFPQARYIFQQFPLPASLHPWAMKAAQYADCAGRQNSAAFWKYIDSIFENQGGIALVTADDKLRQLAGEAGLDANKLAACVATPETDARVKQSLDLGKSLEVNETPTVFINGRRVKGIGSIPYEQLKGLVQFEIEHAGS